MLVPLEDMLFTQIIGSLQSIQPNGAKLPEKMTWKDENSTYSWGGVFKHVLFHP